MAIASSLCTFHATRTGCLSFGLRNLIDSRVIKGYSRTIEAPDEVQENVTKLSPAQCAFTSRFKYGLDELKPSQQLISLMHPKLFPENSRAFNECLLTGANALKFFTYEFLFIKYPRIPTCFLHHSVSLHTRDELLNRLVDMSGISCAISSLPTIPQKYQQLYQEAFVATLGSIIKNHPDGLFKIRSFVHENVTNRMLERSKMLPITERPKQWLYALMKRLDHTVPVYKLEGETGRQSTFPTFLVGVYSGDGSWKLGEGHGPSIRIAERRAARDALERYYLEPENNVYGLLPSNSLSNTQYYGSFIPVPIQDTPAYPLSAPLSL